jgi:hypothetical protein
MAASSESRVEELIAAINVHFATHKAAYLENCVNATKLLLTWIGYLRSSVSREVADRLLDAIQATCIEVAGCLSIGFVRPAVFSIRSQLELLLAWVYFNDHPVEWQYAQINLDEYPMRAENLKYMRSHSDRFLERFALLLKCKKRREDDPYGLLSVHVHSVSAAAAPSIGELRTLVQDKKRCDECVELQKEVAEYLTDVLAAWYADHWHDFPVDIKDHLAARLTPSPLKQFCAN